MKKDNNKSGVIEYADGQKQSGLIKREYGTAFEFADRGKEWWLKADPQREDGPAVSPSGTKEWFLNGRLHREDGPAVDWSDGSTGWYLNGKRHRKDGPAFEFADGCKMWWLNGEELTEEEHAARTN